jgi:hypothetical protein
MAPDVIVLPLAEADVRKAAFWYEDKREGLGAELLWNSMCYTTASRRIRGSFPRSAMERDEH